MGRIILGTLFIFWGLSIFLNFSFFKLFFALIIILIGVRILAGRRQWGGPQNWSSWERMNVATVAQENLINEVVIFGPINKAVKSENFKGGMVKMVFAGGVIDLSAVKTQQNEIELTIKTVFAGLKLIVPKGWKVTTQGSAVFGGYDNRVQPGEGHVTLNLRGSAVFGGIEIVNPS
jgi:predicted membrane protein